jgi:acyl dehydratase
MSSTSIVYPEARMMVNYGLNQVRFPYPVKSGSKVRARVRLVGVTPINNSIELVNQTGGRLSGRTASDRTDDDPAGTANDGCDW